MSLALLAFVALRQTVGSGTMEPFIAAFRADEQGLRRKYDHDGDPKDRARLVAFYRSELNSLQSQDFDSLSDDGRVDYLLIRNVLRDRLTDAEGDQKVWEAARPLVPFAQPIFDLDTDRRSAKPMDYEAVGNELNSLSAQVKAARAAAEARHPNKLVAYETVGLLRGLGYALESWYGFYNKYDPMFDWWEPKPYAELTTALGDYRKFLSDTVVGVSAEDPARLIGSPVGAKALQQQLKAAMIDYSPEELISIADKEYAWCETEMKKASEAMGFGDDWKKALAKVREMHEPPGGEPALIKKLSDEAVAYVTAHDLVTIPSMADETWTMEMMSPERQLVNPFFTGGRTISVSFPTDDMTQEQKETSLRANNRYFDRATVFHELLPGHRLQDYYQQRSRTYRTYLENNPFWVEGWAFYWEMLLFDTDFVTKPEERIGMLFWRMHRSARVVFSLKFQLAQWTPQQCVDYLIEKVGHERLTAEGEVRRSILGGYGPLYQLAYLMGALQFRELNQELVQSGKMTARQFHDAVMQENEIPIELIRAKLTHQTLTRDTETSWRFYPLEK